MECTVWTEVLVFLFLNLEKKKTEINTIERKKYICIKCTKLKKNVATMAALKLRKKDIIEFFFGNIEN